MTLLGKTKTQRMYFLMLAPTAILLALVIYYPVVQGVITAFMRYTMLDLSKTGFIGLGNFTAIITNPNIKFVKILANTAVWVLFSLAGQFVLGFALALLLRKPFKGRGV